MFLCKWEVLGHMSLRLPLALVLDDYHNARCVVSRAEATTPTFNSNSLFLGGQLVTLRSPPSVGTMAMLMAIAYCRT